MSSPLRNRRSTRLRRAVVALFAVTATVAALGVTVSPIANATPKPTPQTSAAQKSAVPTKQVCAATTTPSKARCLALKRTDIAARSGIIPNVDPSGYGPADVQSAYKLPGATAGDGQVVAIVDAFDNPTVEADLAVYRQQYGLPACTSASGCFTKVNQRGVVGEYPAPDPGWASEIALDVDMVSAACPKCKILLVEGDSNSLADLGAAVDMAVQLGAKYVSNSYGTGAEDPSTIPMNAHYDHPGVAITASTGDSGTGASFPASVGSVVAVGGTSLSTDTSARGWTESAWAGAGSGCSAQEAKPSWQDDPSCPTRAEADVSAVADPATGVAVYNSYSDGGWTVYGGTSASSPIIAGTYALAGQPVAATYPGSYPYASRGQLFDVVTGDNGTCTIAYICHAGPGYDGPTGLGTPNGVGAFQTGPHGVVSGAVTSGGVAVVGATVTVGDASATSGADGTYTLTVATGTYAAKATAYGYTTATKTVTVTGGGTVTAAFVLAKVPSQAVTGTVTDGSGHGWPVYAKVTIDGVPGAPVYTDPFTGRYNLTLPRGKTYTAHVAPVLPGYLTRDLTIKVAAADVVKNATVVIDPSTCLAPGYTTTYTGTRQTFDGTTLPAGWTVTDNNASGGVWSVTDAGARGNLTGGSGGFAIIDSDHLGSGNTQDTTLISPKTDLSASTAPILELGSAYKSFINSTADIDVTVDGTTWTNVWEQTTTSISGPISIALPMAAGKKDVQVRFHYTGTWAYYWEVDDVLIGNRSCGPVSGGLVAGFTKDGNTKKALTGVTVASVDVATNTGVSAATPDDGALGDGYYWLFSSAKGAHKFTATSGRYTPATATVNVIANSITRKDFTLAAGRVEVSPADLTATEVLGSSTSVPLTLKNSGTKPAHVELGEQDGGFVIAGKPAPAAYAGMPGAAVRHVAGTYLPTRLAGSGTKPSTTPPVSAAAPSAAPWQAIADYPTAISNNGVAAGDGKIYSVGGYDGSADVATGYAYDPAALSWSPIADMSTIREAPSVGFIGGKLIATGGWGPGAIPTGITEAYDPASNTWTTLAANPKPHAGAGTTVADGKLYVIGGCAAACGSTDVQVYDPAADSWSSAAPYPQDTSWGSCGTIGMIYCAGGTATSTSTKVFSFDTGTNTWAPLGDMPTDVWGAGYSVANGQLLVSGGVINSNAVVTNEGWAFDPSSGAWTALPASNNAFYRLGAACGFYKIGGSASQSAPASASSEVLPGYDSCGAGQDVSWMSESPSTLDLAPGMSATVSVTLDSTTVTQPGTYTGKITVATDTPYPGSSIGVSMVVTPPKTWGKLLGTVSGAACAGTPAPLAGATLQINSWNAAYTLNTAADGTYAMWMDTRSNPLTLIAAKDGWAPQTATVKLLRGGEITKSFTLKPAKACH